jgi:hypothetical protein
MRLLHSNDRTRASQANRREPEAAPTRRSRHHHWRPRARPAQAHSSEHDGGRKSVSAETRTTPTSPRGSSAPKPSRWRKRSLPKMRAFRANEGRGQCALVSRHRRFAMRSQRGLTAGVSPELHAWADYRSPSATRERPEPMTEPRRPLLLALVDTGSSAGPACAPPGRAAPRMSASRHPPQQGGLVRIGNDRARVIVRIPGAQRFGVRQASSTRHIGRSSV